MSHKHEVYVVMAGLIALTPYPFYDELGIEGADSSASGDSGPRGENDAPRFDALTAVKDAIRIRENSAGDGAAEEAARVSNPCKPPLPSCQNELHLDKFPLDLVSFVPNLAHDKEQLGHNQKCFFLDH